VQENGYIKKEDKQRTQKRVGEVYTGRGNIDDDYGFDQGNFAIPVLYLIGSVLKPRKG